MKEWVMKGCDHQLQVTSTGALWFWARYWVRCWRCEFRRGPFVTTDPAYRLIVRYWLLKSRWRSL